jgi:tetratricopeptide (TPR) repeat protein
LASLTGCIPPPNTKKTANEPVAHSSNIGAVIDAFMEQKLILARSFEASGNPVSALREYRIMLAVDPENPLALEGINRLTAVLEKIADEHYQRGMEFNKQGKYLQARHEFLAALRLRPYHHRITNMLVNRKRVSSIRYVIHNVVPGDNLIKISEMYYGDYRKFPVIARYNNLEDATKVIAGSELKIPEIKGFPFKIKKDEILSEEKKEPELRLWDWGALEVATNVESNRDSDNVYKSLQLEEYRSKGIKYFEKNMYHKALVEFIKALNIRPKDETILDYKYKTEFHLAEKNFDSEKYMAARNGFIALLNNNKNCKKCLEYINKSEENYKEIHYRKGMQYFNQEKLNNAIKEWKLVLNMDPNYREVQYLIRKAQKILSNLEDLKNKDKKTK